MRSVTLDLTTHASTGAASATSRQVFGKLYAVKYEPGTIATGATLTLTCVHPNASSKPLLTKATAGTSVCWFYPLDIPHAVADGAVLTATAGGDRVQPILDGAITAAIASGDNSKVGRVVVYYED
jgi:hypothetical protein